MTDRDIVERLKGPVELLCKEIGFPFNRELEKDGLLIAFVAVLVGHIAEERAMQLQIASMTGKPPSDNSGTMLEQVLKLLAYTDHAAMLVACAAAHDLAHESNPEDAYPTDHLIDMLSSCVSAIRFGLEKPCSSRHAAEAADHVWGQIYGVRRFDNHTPDWQHEWARAQFQIAIRAEAAAAITALRADNARLRAEREWRPIETAPRDGTGVLLHLPNSRERKVDVGYWDIEDGYWLLCNSYDEAPDRWQPLPAPPQAPPR